MVLETEVGALIGFGPGGKSRAELEVALAGFGRIEAWAAAGRLGCMAAIDALGDGGVGAADVARARTRRSKKACERAARTAQQLVDLPATRAALMAGEISVEHVDAVADAAERVSAEQADAELCGDAKAQPADLFAKGSRSWATARERRQDQHDRGVAQRRARRASVWVRGDGMVCLYGEFDPVTGKALKRAFDSQVDRLWRADGGRDGKPDEIRSRDQRGADAITDLITARSRAGLRPHPRYMVHLRVDASRLGANPRGLAEFVDGAPLSQAMLERIACEAAFAGAVYDTKGAILWQGRTKRSATDDQWGALIDRDGGCVICAADPAHCHAHHLTRWAPPANGSTDIDNMVLVCNHDHHLIHDHNHRLARTQRRWRLEPPGSGSREQTAHRQRPPPRAAAA